MGFCYIQRLSFTALFAISTLFFHAANGYSKEQTFALEGATVSIDFPASWQAAPGLMGMPLMLLGPEQAAGRAAFSVTPTTLNDLSFDDAALDKSQSEYRAGRTAWVEDKGGSAIEFYPYKKSKTKSGLDLRQIGYRYSLAGTEFTEISYFAICKGQLFHLKSLIRKENAIPQSSMDQMAGSFRCE